MNARVTTADLVVEGLVANGIDTVFCLPGVQNDHLFDAFYRARADLRCVHTRHEQGAAYMALGAAMASGAPAVYNVVPGPGLLNTTAALATAYACNAPVLALTGQIPSAAIGRGYGFLHEVPDQLGVMRSLTKWAARIDSPEQAPHLIHDAFYQLLNGRPRPVALECAIDVWPKQGLPRQANCAVRESRAPDAAAIDAAAALLAGAQHPLIVVGSGAQAASAEVTALAEALHAPVVAHRMGQGVLDGRHWLSANVAAGQRFWSKADVVLAVGTRLQFQQQQWGIDTHLRIIRVDIDAEELCRIHEPAVGIAGDARLVLAALLQALPSSVCGDPARRRMIESVNAAVRAELAYLEPQISLLAQIRAELPDSGIFVDELTQLGYVSRLVFPVYRPRTFLSPGYQGTLGWGVATALGAKVARPDAAVVCVIGDGGFMFNVQELATAVQHRIAVAIVLVNDGAYGNVKRTQMDDFDARVIASELVNPDFVRLAQSFGALGVRICSTEQLRPALAAAFAADVPTVIEIPAKQMPNPWPHLRFRRVRASASAAT